LKKHSTLFYSLLIILCFILGCSAFRKSRTTNYNFNSSNTSEKKSSAKVIKSTDGKFQVSVSDEWQTETTLNKLASIQVSNTGSEMYLIVITEPKRDFPRGYKLSAFTNIVRDQMLKTVSDAEATTPESVSVSGNSAMRYELSGTVNGIKAKYMNTTVETKDHFHQVLCWTRDSKFSTNKPGLLEVIDSFKEAN